jgi:hypothetical protein
MSQNTPAPRGTFGIREFLGAVNLRDFAQMVGAEVSQISSILSAAFEAFPRFPAGPLIFLWGTAMAGIRSFLLVLVVLTFGAGIIAISVSRVAARLLRFGRKKPRSEEPLDLKDVSL